MLNPSSRLGLTPRASRRDRSICNASARPGKISRRQFGFEEIVPGGDRCMGGENGFRCDQFQCTVKIQSPVAPLPAALENLKGRMPFVDMPDRGRKSHGPQGAHTADAERHLLLNAVDRIAAIELVGDRPVGFRVVRKIAVQQIQPDMPGLDSPYPENHLTAGQFDTNRKIAAFGVGRRPDWQMGDVDRGIAGYLGAPCRR